MYTWEPDQLLDRYETLILPLGSDPDGEDPITATLIRPVERPESPRGAVLYVHGFTDYFFHEPVAEYFTSRGYDFYAIDLRKCGRSLTPTQTPHYTTDLKLYDLELGMALDRVVQELSNAGVPARVIIGGHSTGGLITSLWLDRLHRTDPDRHRHVVGLLLNSPWFDLQGKAALRTLPASLLFKAVGQVKGKTVVPTELSQAYGQSLHASLHGEWTYDLERKPLNGFPVTFGFLSAVRTGHAELHRGLDVGVPSLILRSDATHFAAEYSPEVDEADAVLDVKQIARWAGCVGDRVSVVPVPGARHDVFLSKREPRERAYDEVGRWLDAVIDYQPDPETKASADV